MLFAEASTLPDIFGLIETSGFAGVTIYMIRWMMSKFEQELRDIRSSHDSSNARTARAMTANSLAIVALQKQFLAHDLTVSGVNPSAGVDVDERADRALAKYTELQHSLDEMSRAISKLIEE